MATAAPDAQLWRLVSLDPEVQLDLRGRYPLTDVRDGAGIGIDTPETSSGAAPATISTGRRIRTIAFATELRSEHASDDIRQVLARLRALRDPDPTLGRHVRVRFEHGADAPVEGKITGLDLAITELWWTGFPRVVGLDVVLTESAELSLDLEPTRPAETMFVRPVDGESFEDIALRMLGDARYGEPIRRLNPGAVYSLGPASEVKVLEASHPEMRRRILPRSIALGAREQDPERFAVLLRELLAARAVPGAGGRRWEDLDEVRSGLV